MIWSGGGLRKRGFGAVFGLMLVSGLAAACKGKGDPLGEQALASSPAAAAEIDGVVSEVLATSRHPWLRWPVLTDVAPALNDLYAAESDRLVWFEEGRSRPALPSAIDSLARAHEYALKPSDYDAARIQEEWKRLQIEPPLEAPDRALFDLAVSVGILREMQAVHSGRVDPRILDWGFDVSPKKRLGRADLLRGALDGAGIPALLESLEPSFPHYQRNRRTLAHYRRLAEAGEPELVPPLPKGQRKVEPGVPWEGVFPMRARLEIFGDLESGSPVATAPDGTPLYEGALVDAVKRFQVRHILDADGVVGAATITALNVPVAARVRQLEMAMERGRWLPRLDDAPSIFVNVPLFRLWASDPLHGEEPVRMKVVVGKSLRHHTPMFIENMQYVIFRPYWNPPPSIVKNEILPSIRRDPAYFEKEDLEIVASGETDAEALPPTPENLEAVARGRLFIRQKPGPGNSLGLAKFIFPNRANVYMHGTPAGYLFARTRRDFSHGCIRVEDPTTLAEWVLHEVPGWTRERIEAAMQGDGPTQVNLPEPLRVVIFYDTVHVNSENVVHFVSDIYGHDRVLDEVLERGYPYPVAD
jgi:murein L,D-transpeptidase YcbB/YkuD